jgi:hypothetical protein
MPDNGDGAMIEEQMMHIVGLHEVSQAQVPGRVEAAKAIEMLKESDADRQATMLDTITADLRGLLPNPHARQAVRVRGHVSFRRTPARACPRSSASRPEAIKPGMRVMVTMGTGLARSRAARQDQLMNMWQNQIITDPELMAELMEVPIPSFTEPKALDAAPGPQREPGDRQLVGGHPPARSPPNSWDDHEFHPPARAQRLPQDAAEYLTARRPGRPVASQAQVRVPLPRWRTSPRGTGAALGILPAHVDFEVADHE